MKKILLVCFGIVALACHGQEYAMRVNDGVLCGLYLVDDGSYYIDVEPRVEHWVALLPSFGQYTETASRIYLHDDMNHFEIVLKKSSPKKLKVVKGFCFMKGASFELFRSQPCDRNMAYPYPGHAVLESLAEDYRSNDSIVNSMPLGEYRTRKHVDPAYSISLLSNGTYYLKYRNVVLSKGNFNRENNLLLLWDRDLDATFPMLINDKELRACGFPTFQESPFVYDEWE